MQATSRCTTCLTMRRMLNAMLNTACEDINPCVLKVSQRTFLPLCQCKAVPLVARKVVNIVGAQLPEMQLQLPRKPLEGTEKEDRSKVRLIISRCSRTSFILWVGYSLSSYVRTKP